MGTWDAIAVGGGVAGAAFALELARHGRRVLVIERSRSPRLKVCGEFLSGHCETLLARLGIDLQELGAAPLAQATLEHAGRSVSFALPFAAAGLARTRLEEAMLGAVAKAGAEVLRGSTATTLSQRGRDVIVTAGGREFRAGAAALATGKHDLRGWQRRRGGPTAFKMTYAVRASAAALVRDRVRLVLYPGGYLGACPVGEGTATICWLAGDYLMRRSGGRWRSQLAHIGRSSAWLRPLLESAEPLAAKPCAVAAIPYGYIRPAATAAAVYPIGDQLAVIPSFTGDGTCLAIASGIAAAQSLLAGSPAEEFRARFVAEAAPQLRWAKTLDWALAMPGAHRLVIPLLGAAPRLAVGLARRTRLPPAAVRRICAPAGGGFTGPTADLSPAL